MKSLFVKICAWFSVIFYLIMSFASLIILLTESIEPGMFIVLFIFVLMSMTGWKARKFGSESFYRDKYSTILAILTLLLGIFFLVFAPIMFVSLFDFKDTYSAIITLLIFFSPAVICAIAVLFGHKKTLNIAK